LDQSWLSSAKEEVDVSNNEVVMDFEENAPFDVCVERIAIQTAEPCIDVRSVGFG
jgi:hypothetical protein